MENKNILFIGPYSKKPKGGVAFVLFEYKKLYPNSFFIASTISKNSITKIYGFIFGILRLFYLLTTKKKLKLVHIHGSSYKSFVRKIIIHNLCKAFKRKTIYHIHGSEYQLFYEQSGNFMKQKIAEFINNTDCLICLSESWKAFFLNNFNPKRIEIIPNIIANPIHSCNKIKDNSLIIFQFLGFIDERKGVWLLLETLKIHKNKIIGKAIFNIGGNGETQKLQRLIKEYELEEVVNFMGWVSGEDKQQCLQEADVYLLPSYNEGLPISILEAMSYSLPILSTSVGGIPEIVSSENGFLISPGSKIELWKGINYFIGLISRKRNKLGQNSLKKVHPHFPKQVRTKLNQLYEQLLNDQY